MDGTDPEQSERIRINPKNNNAVIEHFLLSSSSEVKGQQINAKKLIEDFVNGDEQAGITLLTPIFLLEGTKTLTEVNKARAEESQKRTSIGYIEVLDIASFMQLGEFNPYLEPSSLKDGKIIPQWKIFLLDDNRVSTKDLKAFENLKIDKEFSLFQLGPVEINNGEHGEEPYVLLTFGKQE